MPSILVLSVGATALQRYDEVSGSMQLKLQPSQLVELATPSGVEAQLQQIDRRSGAELVWSTITQLRDAALAALQQSRPVVILAGTDTLEELAFALHLMLAFALLRLRVPLLLAGAMLPADQLGTDNAKNLRDAMLVAADAATPPAALVVMNDSIHLAQYVRKADSQLAGAFASHPGPLGQVRGGRPLFYYQPPPAAGPAWLPDERFAGLAAEALEARRVAIWTLGVSAFLPEQLLEQLDGLVLAGSGTGSVPSALVDQLSPAWTDRLPIVVVSRCSHGQNCDDFYYRGSRAKYESRGFVLGRGYDNLNPLQARTLLVLRLAALGHA